MKSFFFFKTYENNNYCGLTKIALFFFLMKITFIYSFAKITSLSLQITLWRLFIYLYIFLQKSIFYLSRKSVFCFPYENHTSFYENHFFFLHNENHILFPPHENHIFFISLTKMTFFFVHKNYIFFFFTKILFFFLLFLRK